MVKSSQASLVDAAHAAARRRLSRRRFTQGAAITPALLAALARGTGVSAAPAVRRAQDPTEIEFGYGL